MFYRCEAGETNELTDARKCLNGSGLGDVRIFRDSVIKVPYILNQFTFRLTDHYKAEWMTGRCF